ncbi:MAG: ATPase domain-containing protein [Candidatus Bathyarchaeia archaeon]|nr:AAA family ATPase [Candidatus Bathyarchaeota archaeon]
MTLQFIPTGCSKLDELLGGGIPIGRLTLIYGEASSGKTTIALQVSVSAARIGLKVLYMDCDNSLRIERLRAITKEDFDNLSKRIIVSRPESFIEQSLIIGSLPRIISRDVGLVVVDSITNLYREAISLEEPFTVNWEFNRQIALLKESAITKNIAVLAISQVRSVLETGGIEPVSRRIMLYWPDIVITLSKTTRPGIILCEVKKGGVPGKFYAHISDQGLVSI